MIAAMIHANRPPPPPPRRRARSEYETFVRNLPFYTQSPQLPITDDAGAVSFLKSNSASSSWCINATSSA
jgi:hypothetical protein